MSEWGNWHVGLRSVFELVKDVETLAVNLSRVKN